MLCFSCVIVKRLFISILLARVHLVLFFVSVYQKLLNNTHLHHTLKWKTSLKNLSLRNSLGTTPLGFVRSFPKWRSRDQVTAPDSLLAPKVAPLPSAGRQSFERFLADGVHIDRKHFWRRCRGQIFCSWTTFYLSFFLVFTLFFDRFLVWTPLILDLNPSSDSTIINHTRVFN